VRAIGQRKIHLDRQKKREVSKYRVVGAGVNLFRKKKEEMISVPPEKRSKWLEGMGKKKGLSVGGRITEGSTDLTLFVRGLRILDKQGKKKRGKKHGRRPISLGRVDECIHKGRRKVPANPTVGRRNFCGGEKEKRGRACSLGGVKKTTLWRGKKKSGCQYSEEPGRHSSATLMQKGREQVERVTRPLGRGKKGKRK